MTHTIEPVLNSNGDNYFEISSHHVSIVEKDEDGWPYTVEADISLTKTEIAEHVINQDYQWLKENKTGRRFLDLVEHDDGSKEFVFKKSLVDEDKKMIEQQDKDFVEKFTTQKKSNIYGRKKLVKGRMVLSENGRGEWR